VTWFVKNFESLGSTIAIIDKTIDYSYLQLSKQIQEFKVRLDEKIIDGQVVAILSDYNFYSIALFFALLEKKSIIVPIVYKNNNEIKNKLRIVDCDVQIQLHGSNLEIVKRKALSAHSMIQQLVNLHEAGLILFSSGSTGEPKAMVHNLDNLINSYKGKRIKKTSILIFLMFDHIGGLNTLLNALSMGAKIVLPENRNPEYIAQLIEYHRIQILPVSPTFLNMIFMSKVHEKYNLSSLRMITYGTESMPESLLKKLKLAFPKTKLLQTFGTSETGISKASSRSSSSLDFKLDPLVSKYKVVNGELWLKSKTQIIGYLNASMRSFKEDDWFNTGDLVEELNDGYIRIRGRSKDVINVGGEKVLPIEVESVVQELKEVYDCLVYGQKNAITGQMVALQVVLKKSIKPGIAKGLIRSHCKKKLDIYKVPVKIEFVNKVDFSNRFKKTRS
jgi:acyl-CoA synthetase (AMP-forming)/AMP-acid ligase II